EYSFEWRREGALITSVDADVLEGGSRIYAKLAGVYTVLVTDNDTGCFTTRRAEVYQAASITIDEIKITDSFGDTNAIEVIAYSQEDFDLEYKLDDGQWQDSNIFLDVTPGEHTIYVRAKDSLS